MPDVNGPVYVDPGSGLERRGRGGKHLIYEALIYIESADGNACTVHMRQSLWKISIMKYDIQSGTLGLSDGWAGTLPNRRRASLENANEPVLTHLGSTCSQSVPRPGLREA